MGHRSALAQNSLLMYPLLFPSFGLVVGLVCPRQMVDWSPLSLRCCECIPVGCRSIANFVDMWVAEGHTARLRWLCVLFVHRLSVWV